MGVPQVFNLSPELFNINTSDKLTTLCVAINGDDTAVLITRNYADEISNS